MYEVGELLKGWRYNDEGVEVEHTGTFAFRTNDPEEYIQDIVLTIDGKYEYFDEQDVRRA